MEVVYFSKQQARGRDPFLRTIEGIAAGRKIIATSGIDEFREKLAPRPGRRLLAVVIAGNEDMLIDVYFARCLLRGVSSILVLPDNERHTAALGYRIGPDHIFPMGTGMGEIASTVAKVLQRGSADTTVNDAEGTYDRIPPDHFIPGGEKKAANF